ncbi:MAG: HlyD family efflux transporter periplasmic adaptor subunit [Solibacteraceae bacterium]|nr:HlyD family efflux transporter periplasmic adaptor subunit [Solibacteraceae bacterium]
MILLAVLIAGGAGVYFLRDQIAPVLTGGGGGAGPVVVNTTPVTRGTLERTIRLSGTTVAERYASLIAPQLRGGRGGGMSVSSFGGGGGRGGMVVTISSGGGGGGGSSSSSSTGSSSTTSAATSAVASALSGAGTSGTTGATASSGGRTGGFRSSGTSRFSGGGSSGGSSSAGSSGAASAAAAAGGAGGEAAMEGMSGGVSDFMQVLQKAAEGGKMVKKGDIVAEFDRQYQETRLDDFRASVEQSQMSLRITDSELEVTRKARALSIEQARAAVEKAKLDIKTTPVLSQIQAEMLKLQLEEAEARLQQLLGEVKFQQISEQAQRRNTELSMAASRKELEMAERNIGRMSLAAPMDGMVVMQQTFRSGELVQIKEGDQLMSGQMFMQIVDPTSMMVSATVNQTDVELIRVGAQARLHFDAYPGMELPGRVVSIGAMTKTGGQRADFVKEIPVFIKVEGLDPRVIPDLSVSADVVVEEAREQIVVPLESVHWDGGADGAPYVFVRTATGFERRAVELGMTSNVKAAVKSGLKEGETVATERPPEKKSSGKDPRASLPREMTTGVKHVEGC